MNGFCFIPCAGGKRETKMKKGKVERLLKLEGGGGHTSTLMEEEASCVACCLSLSLPPSSHSTTTRQEEEEKKKQKTLFIFLLANKTTGKNMLFGFLTNCECVQKRKF
jgi:hypothetical protein